MDFQLPPRHGAKIEHQQKGHDEARALKRVVDSADVAFTLKPVDVRYSKWEKHCLEPIAQFIRKQGRIILSFSAGKDSLTCWCILRELGVEVKPFYLYMIPGISWIEDYLAYLEDWSGEHITRCLHPQVYTWIRTYGFQTPERAEAIELLDLPQFDYPDIEGGVRRTLAARHGEVWRGVWSCVGTRTQDSPQRRRSFDKYGWKRTKLRKLYPIWNFSKQDVIDTLRRHKVKLSPCYRMFGRSFDGVDYRFLDGIRTDYPEDYQRILEWVPLAGAEFARVRFAVKHGIATVS